MTFCEVLKDLRLKSGLTQVELAKAVGLRQSHISSWESGMRLPLPDGLIKLADFFGCSVDYLLGRGHCENKTVDFPSLISNYEKLPIADRCKVLGYIDCLLDK